MPRLGNTNQERGRGACLHSAILRLIRGPMIQGTQDFFLFFLMFLLSPNHAIVAYPGDFSWGRAWDLTMSVPSEGPSLGCIWERRHHIRPGNPHPVPPGPDLGGRGFTGLKAAPRRLF